MTGLSGRPDKTARIHEKVAVRKTFGRYRESAGLSFWGFELNNDDELSHAAFLNAYLDYSPEEAEQMGAFVEDALSFEEVRESMEDLEPEND